MPRICVVVGTRPEAIKLSPVILALREEATNDVQVCLTGQHADLVAPVLRIFNVAVDASLAKPPESASLARTTSAILDSLGAYLQQTLPNVVVVQGDTTTTLCGALAGFYAGIPVGHVEAGLRTFDARHPFPEELNRTLVGRLATLHFAATTAAADNLRREMVAAENIFVTGNTGIDALLYVRDCIRRGEPRVSLPVRTDSSRRIILVTAHRRENHGAGLRNICDALRQLAARGDVEIVYPLHPNPNVSGPVGTLLDGVPHIHLIPPVDYMQFVALLDASYLILTDSGGIQEEAPSLGKPLVVLRERTERPEGVAAGTAFLVGTNEKQILLTAARLLDDPPFYEATSRAHNPYGDGTASKKIAHTIRERLGSANGS